MASAKASGFSGSTINPALASPMICVASPGGQKIIIGNPIAIDSKIFDGITLLNSGVSRKETSDMSHKLHSAGIISFGFRLTSITFDNKFPLLEIVFHNAISELKAV